MSAADFASAVAFTLSHEGDKDGSPHNDPHDPGGNTRWGLAQKYHPSINVMLLERDQAVAVYKAAYWDKYSCDLLPFPWNCLHFDTCVNPGPVHAKEFLDAATSIEDYLMRRMIWYARIVSEYPEKERYLKGWLWRSADFFHSFMLKGDR